MDNLIDKETYQDADHAGTYRQLQRSPERDTPEIDADFETLMRDGYVIIENLISDDTCASIKAEGLSLLEHTGRNAFEGHKTQRVYNVLGKTRSTDRLADHPRILGLMDRFFRPGFLLSQSQIINILPGENAQGLHVDDGFYRILGRGHHLAPRRYGPLMSSPKTMALQSSFPEAMSGAKTAWDSVRKRFQLKCQLGLSCSSLEQRGTAEDKISRMMRGSRLLTSIARHTCVSRRIICWSSRKRQSETYHPNCRH